MKKLALLGLAMVSFLTSCSIDWNDTNAKKLSELEKQVADLKNTTVSSGMILFEKRTRCAGLDKDIQSRLDSVSKEYSSLGKFSIGGIFYSPTKDACLWVRLTSTYATDGTPMERRALYQYGDDFGTAEPTIGCEKMLGEKQGTDTCANWDTEIRKLKGETGSGASLNP